MIGKDWRVKHEQGVPPRLQKWSIDMNGVFSHRPKNHVVDGPKKAGFLNRARSQCWVLLFRFCEIFRADLKNREAL